MLFGNVDDDDGMVYLLENIKGFLKKKALTKRGEMKNDKPQCYECKGFSHMRNEYLILIEDEVDEKKKGKEKKRAKKYLKPL